MASPPISEKERVTNKTAMTIKSPAINFRKNPEPFDFDFIIFLLLLCFCLGNKISLTPISRANIFALLYN